METTTDEPGTFDLVKVDGKVPTKKLEGARFKLNGANVEATTGPDGKATFSNIAPGSYTLIETKAPDGYKLDQKAKNVTITTNGEVSITGPNASFSGGDNKTEMVDHDRYPAWPDYMNAMRYGKLKNGQLNFYLYLKARAATENGSTDRDTRLAISIPGVNVTGVTAYDVSSDNRADIRTAMENQTVEGEIASLGGNVIGAPNNKNKIITGTANVTDPYTGREGYQIFFPKERFANDWGFLVKVTATVDANKTSVPLYYDWLTNEDTDNQTKLQQLVTVNSENNGDNTPTVTITNEEFKKQSVSVTKVDKDKNTLTGATFVLKDKNNRPINDVDTDANGVADFGKLPAGKYIIEEIKAPNEYLASSVVFDVTVADDGQVTYTPRYKNSAGDPVQGTDYYIDSEESTQEPGQVTYKVKKNEMAIQENEPGDIGQRTGVWEAYRYESLKYSATIDLTSSAPGSRFSIQFDPNLDFKQYVSDLPKIMVNRVAVADPYFDYTTNRLTYVFNENSKGGFTTANINIRGITPSKFYAQNSGGYNFKTTVLPDVAPGDITTENGATQTIDFHVTADYERYDTSRSSPAQSYYHRDIYTGADGNEYFTVLAYYNPLADNNRSPRTLSFNWLSTGFGGNNTQIVRWPANGNKPAFDLQNVKIYRTSPDIAKDMNGVRYNKNMPLSFGVRPEQDPNTYTKVYEKTITDQVNHTGDSANGFTLNYDPDKIQSWGTLDQNKPLRISMPGITRSNEGYIIEQTFKVNDKDKWYNLFRAFYMYNGVMESAFASKVNRNTGTADQTAQEIPKFYKQTIKLVNRKYTPGKFSIEKFSSTDENQKLRDATFALTNDKGQTIYRTTDKDGKLNFTDLEPGNYALVETKAPKNFVKSDQNWQVAVSNTGKVTITEMSMSGDIVVGDNIILKVPNKPIGQKFRVYKKDASGIPLPGAEFKITKKGEITAHETATSNQNGYVEFNNLTRGNTYILEETKAPAGYNKLNKKWVVVVDQDNKAKVYNYVENTTTRPGIVKDSLFGGTNTHWVDVAHRPLTGWDLYDNRWGSYVDNHHNPYIMGTRILGINKTEKYVIQRYVLNPEGNTIADAKVEIHREKPNDQNMDWHDNSLTSKEDFRVYKLDKRVTGPVEDVRLAEYKATPMTQTTDFTTGATKKTGEPLRKKFEFKNINTPIIIDVKVPYKEESGGVGTGMDLWIDNKVYWKSDFYERVSDIVVGDSVTTDDDSAIIGSYISEGSLDVTNEQKKYSFKLKKVKDTDDTATIQGATFSLKGPGENGEERSLVTDENGIIQFNDLVEGTYTLKETSPASGYDKVNTTWTVTITKDGKVFMKDDGSAGASAIWGVATDTGTPAHQMSRSMMLNNFLAPFGEEAAPVSAEAPVAEEAAEAKQSAEKAPSATAEKKDAAYGAAPMADEISATKQLNNFLTTFGANDGLELGEENVPTPVGAGAWEAVDPDKSDPATTKNGQATEIETKITQINKAEGKYRQIFLVNKNRGDMNSPTFDFHAEPLSTNLIGEGPGKPFNSTVNFNILSIRPVSTASTLTNLQYTGRDIGYTGQTNFKDGQWTRFRVTLNKSFSNDMLAIEVEYTYPSSGEIGMGMNFRRSYRVSNDARPWASEKYSSVNAINYLHKVNVQPATNGSFTANPNVRVQKGTTVTLTPSPDTGYELDHYTVTNTKTQETTTFTDNTFIMPDADVNVTATFRKKAPPKYKVTVNGMQNGTVTASPTETEAGKTVQLQVTPAGNYQLQSITVTDGQGNTIPVDMANYTFTMPPSNVSVSAIFVEKPPETYNVNLVSSPPLGGTVGASPTSGKAGTEVTVSATANTGYTLDTISVVDANNKPVTLANNKFTMPASNVTVTATFTKNPDPQTPGTEIHEGELALIKNKQTGLDMKIFKKNFLGTGLKDAIFILTETESDYTTEKPGGKKLKAKSDDKGRLIFIDEQGNPLDSQLLPEGYYVLKEDKAPLGYKKITAPWNIHVKEENGQLIAEYYGPEETASTYLNLIREENGKLVDKAMVKELTTTPSGIKYASRVVNIDPETKTFRQRLYLDTRSIADTINVQINPVIKREEKDTPGQPPETLSPGVKTAYRTTYKVADPGANPDVDSILKSYDLSNKNVAMVNTARWRPFDWGFDEDQLNLTPGVYFIDVEGYYDDNIVKDGKIDIKFDFFRGERTFREATGVTNGYITYKSRDKVLLHDSYQNGDAKIAEALGANGDAWKKRLSPDGKYPNWIGKLGGRVYPAVDPKDSKDVDHSYVDPMETQTTSININPLYTSSKPKVISESGMIITDEEETYNITFSKHGKDGDDESWNNTGAKVAENRLEGAVFKLQQWAPLSNRFEDVKGSYVASAFNGYFGFRGLKPGRYRLMEVKAPEGYKPIEGAILEMTIAYKDGEPDKDTGNITPGKGQITLEYKDANGIIQYVDAKNHELNSKLVDFVTSGTAKNMGKIVNTKPGKGEVTVTKVDENGTKLPNGATFRLTRLAAGDKATADDIRTLTVGDDGTVKFDGLGIGNYRLEERSPHPGHMNTGMVWNFTVGGKTLDPYAEDANQPTRDITDNILLKKSDVKVQKYMEGDNTPTDNNIYPHKAQSVSILSDFKLKDSAPAIQPGDYFTVKISDSIDLQGIYKNRSISNLDIFADGVGTVAKAKYNKEEGTITYTFTDYAKSYNLEDFKTQLVAWINLEEIKEDKENVRVGIGLGGKDLPDSELKTKPLNVHYDIDKETSSIPDYNVYDYNYNISGKIYELDPNTGEFVQYYYINRQKTAGGVMPRFKFYANHTVNDVSISIDKLKDNNDDMIKKWMPESFAVPAFDNRELWPTARFDRRQITEYTYDFSDDYYEGMGEDDSYIVTVRGKVDPTKAKDLHTYGQLLLWNRYGYPYVQVAREDWAYFDENKTEAKAALAIRAVNPANKVVFEKVDIDGKPLAGATFTLFKKDPKTGEFGGTGQSPKSGDDGLITFEKIEPGEYQIRETGAPAGYAINEDILLEFTVDASGKIIKKVKGAAGNPVGQGEEEDGSVPIRVTNHRLIQLEKKDANDKTFLAGAEFDVYYKEKEDGKYEKYEVKDNSGKMIPYHVAVGQDGKVSLKLYKAGYYALEETKAPKDYIKPPVKFVKEFRLEDDRFSIKEKGFDGNIKKEAYGTDADTSFVLGEKNSDISGAFNAYVVINPAHEERSYKPGANVLFNYKDLGYYTMLGYRIDKDGKRTDFIPDVTWQEGHDPKADLYKAAGGTTEAEFKTTDTIVLKLVATPDKAENPVTITTAITDGSGTKKAEYKFKYGDLPQTIDTGTYPKHPEAPDKPANYDSDDKAKADYDKAYADYKRTLADVIDHYRNKDLTIQYKETEPVEVLNYKGVYPFTGGFGPRWIVIIGAIIAAVAAEEYIRRKRTSAPKGGA
ncbi:SpaA isopeptide-forming pilin-related protein [Aedoeadaptatus urinae]|uniref:SpaA isopeptide-forming pilin-related protein n=1 Tax=Aedoeadaptatus urinae TaxID=1871017 RepID=UPI00117FA8BC|nr:SpaA isopeptide-forming pilin-related protein [Peptoniphilus urinae]